MTASAVNDRLAQFAESWRLPPAAPGQLATILDAVAVEPTSITTVRAPEDAVDVHVADSLSLLAVDAVRRANTIADLGAGGGFPGLVLAAALPDAALSLVESVGKKCEFLRRAAQEAALSNVDVVNARAEAWREGIGTQDVVVARALAPLNVLVEYAAPLLADDGTLVAMKARRDPSEEADGVAAAAELGLEPAQIVPVEPFTGSGERHLHLYLKVRPTPPKYPRREGMARKRPIQASSRG